MGREALVTIGAALEREKELDLLYRTAPVGLCLVDRELRCIRINEHLAALHGVSIADHIGRTLREVVPDIARRAETHYAQVIESGEPLHRLEMEAPSPADPSVTRHWLISYYPLKAADGVVQAVSTVVEDVTAARATQRELDERLRFEQLLSDLSATIVHVSAADIDREIVRSLRKLVDFLNVDRATIAELSHGDSVLRITHNYTVPGTLPIPATLKGVRWYVETLKRGEPILLERLPQDLPGEAQHEGWFVRGQGIKSQIGVPLILDGAVVGAMGFASLRRYRTWPEELVPRLVLLGQVFAHALARKRADEAVSQRREIQAQLHESEGRLRRLVETTRAVPWEADARTWTFTYVGPQAGELLGYPLERWYEEGFWTRHIHPEDRDAAIAYCESSSMSFTDYEFQYRMIAADGRSVWLHDIVSVELEDGEPAALRGYMIDITERKQAEDALRELSGRLINAQEEERVRLARELHDDLSQKLALVTVELEQLARHSPDARAELRAAQRRIREISTDVHRLSYQLHPSKLEQLGLEVAIKSLCRDLSAQGAIEVGVSVEGIPRQLRDDIALCFYRVAQESLTNAVKHSRARRARVELAARAGAIELRVSDTGLGFDPGAVEEGGGLGLVSMRERLRQVGGELTIDSHPSRGTVIHATAPL